MGSSFAYQYRQLVFLRSSSRAGSLLPALIPSALTLTCTDQPMLSCASLAQKQPGLLEELQGQAKVWSNEGLIRVVFVLSDGAGLPQMKRALFPENLASVCDATK